MLARNPNATWEWSPTPQKPGDTPPIFTLGVISAALENRVMAGCMEMGRFNDDRILQYTGELLAEGLRGVTGLKGAPADLKGAALEPYVPVQVRGSMAYAIFNGAQLTESESD